MNDNEEIKPDTAKEEDFEHCRNSEGVCETTRECKDCEMNSQGKGMDENQQALLDNFELEANTGQSILEDSLISKLLNRLKTEDEKLYHFTKNSLTDDDFSNLTMLDESEQMTFIKKIASIKSQTTEEEEEEEDFEPENHYKKTNKKTKNQAEITAETERDLEKREKKNCFCPDLTNEVNSLYKKINSIEQNLSSKEQIIDELKNDLKIKSKEYFDLNDKYLTLKELNQTSNSQKVEHKDIDKPSNKELASILTSINNMSDKIQKKPSFFEQTLNFIFWNLTTLIILSIIFIKF